jgi:hypothetical protein
MKKQKLLKLTKLTISNLDRVKGGTDPCKCHEGLGDGEANMINLTLVTCPTMVTCQNPCEVPI